MFGSEALAELHTEARDASYGLTWIAERLESSAEGASYSEHQAATRAAAADLRSCAAASRVSDDGELEAVA